MSIPKRKANFDPNTKSSKKPKVAPGLNATYTKGEDEEDLVVNKYVPMVSPEQSLLSTMSVYGKRGSGKSVFLKWFCQYFKDEFPYIYVFTKTAINGFYKGFVPEEFIMDHLSESRLLKILARQEKALDLFHRSDGQINPKVLVIMDDENENVRYSSVLERFYYHGRHMGIFIIFCAQHWSITPPAIRTQTDIAILFNSDYRNAIDEFWEDFAGKSDKKAFYRMMEKYLNDHGFIAIDNQPNVPYDKKFYYGKAEELPAKIDYILGCEQAWAGQERQLFEIETGKLEKKAKRISALKKPGMFKGLPNANPPEDIK